MSHPKLDQIGGYRVLEYIAEGGMAWVFKVQHPNLDRRLALKLLKTTAGSGDEVRLFKREIDQLTKATHPNLVWILDQGQDPQSGSFWYAMEYLAGDNMREQVRRDGPVTPEAAVKLFSGLLAGLQTLHARNVVHRDIKPSNIMIEPGDQAKLMDLGIARVLEGDGSQDVSYTNANVVRGTPAYMAPEQSAAKALTPASDIFAVGLTLYYALTGQSVYEALDDVDSTSGEDIRGYLYFLDRQHRNLHLQLPKEIPRGLQKVVRKATQTEPSARYQSADEMLVDLEKSLEPNHRMRWLAGGAAALALLALLFFAGGPLLQGGGATQPGSEKPVWEPWEIAQKAALAARMQAEVRRVDLPEYQAQMDRAAQGLADAQAELDRASNDEQRVAAGTLFDAVAQLYQEAASAPAASERRAEALALESRKRKQGVSDFGRWNKMKRSAELSYRNGQFVNAEDDFAKGIAYLSALSANAAPRISTRSPDSAVVIAAPGEPVRLAVSAADPEGKPLRYAWSLDGNALSDEDGSSLELEAGTVRREVSVVVTDADGRSVSERWSIEATAPLALITARPAEDELTITRGQPLVLSVEASGSELSYRWSVDGAARPEKGRQLSFRPSQTSTVEVAISDDAGAQVTRRWNVSVKPKPVARIAKPLRVLSRDPLAPRVDTERGRQIALRVRAGGDELQYSWRLDGKTQSASGPSLSFRAERSLRAEVTIEDRHGKTALQGWDVVVTDAARARPPEIVSRSPEAERVKVTRGSRTTLEVRARGDGLRTSWAVNGEPASATGSSFTLTVNESTLVEARIRDARRGDAPAATVRWRIDVNQAPVIARITPSQTARLAVGETRRFRIEARDPDDDDVELEWRRDGRRVARGSDYTFVAERPGVVQLTAVARDAWASSEVPVAVTVAGAQVSRAEVETQFATLLGNFERAYESCDKEQLSRLWRIPAAEDGQWRFAVCKSEFDLQLTLVPGSASLNASKGAAQACVDWVLTRGRKGTASKRVTFRVLVRPDWEAARVHEILDGCTR